MNFKECVNDASKFLDLKRNANEYVIDYKRLDFDELKSALIKTAPQYYNEENLREVICFFELHQNRELRILFQIMVRHILLNKDGFMEKQRTLEDEVVIWEQRILDDANEIEIEKISDNIQSLSYILEAAWQNNNEISIDEQNLLNKVKARLTITDYQYYLLETKLGKFPKPGNILHTRDSIANARKQLQYKGLLFSVRDSSGIDYDVVPDEIVAGLRAYFKKDIKEYSYYQMLQSKYVRNKNYLIDVLTKACVDIPKTPTLSVLQGLIVERVMARNLLGGYSSRDGLNSSTLAEWCSSLNVNCYGTKNDLIDRIISYYDEVKQITLTQDDERVIYYQFFNDLASRNLDDLRKHNIITKDIECERKFEEATNYIFEVIFKNKPLMLKGTEHPDGMLSFSDKLIMWDNKSKESEVNLADHIKQFDRYISKSEKPVAIFIVIGPAFTEDSAKECVKYTMSSDTLILLITAGELKELAEQWHTRHKDDDVSFPLGFFKQNGRFNSSLVSI